MELLLLTLVFIYYMWWIVYISWIVIILKYILYDHIWLGFCELFLV